MPFALRLDAVMPSDGINQAKRAVHVDPAAAYRLAALNDWDGLVYTHLSATVPGEADHFPINAFGLAFDEITTSNLIRISGRSQLTGDQSEGAVRPSVNVMGSTSHAIVHAAWPDAQCVIHPHNTAGITMSAQKHGLPLLSQHALCFRRCIAYHDYEGLASMPEEDVYLTTLFGDRSVMLLCNHGTLTIGRIVAEAHALAVTLIKTCEVQIQIQIQAQTGGKAASPALHVADRAAEQLEDGGAIEGMIEWPALLRKLDEIDALYRGRHD